MKLDGVKKGKASKVVWDPQPIALGDQVLSGPRELLRACELTAWELDPHAGLALGQIGSEAKVVLTDAAATARISREGDGYRIEISPRFVREHVRSAHDLLFVLLHEIRHKVQGDLLRRGKNDPVSQLVANIVADVRINGDLCREHFPRSVGLLDRLYARLSVPSLLLLPPHRLFALFGPARGFPEGRRCSTIATVGRVNSELAEQVVAQTFLDAGFDPARVAELATWYLKAWLEPSSHDALFNKLRRLIVEKSDVAFLGHHGDGQGARRRRRERATEAGYSEDVIEQAIEVETPRDPLDGFRKQIREALEPDSRVAREEARLPDRGVYPHAGRREAYLLAAGAWPVFFPTPDLGAREDTGSVRVYVDVSGSTGQAQPLVYGIVRSLGTLVREPVFLFSNVVQPISLAQVHGGLVRTTGGTDFDCVAEHALAVRARKILVVTDAIGPLEPSNGARLEEAGVEVYVLLTEPLRRRTSITQVARKVWNLPCLDRHDDLPF